MTDVYRIGVEIALVGTITQGLEAVASKLLGINTRVKDIEGGFRRWGLALAGAGALLGAEKIAVGVEKAVSAGGELVKQQALLRNMGIGPSEVMATTLAAQRATNEVIGTTIAENVKGMRELLGVMPNLAEAQAGYVPIMRAAKVLESLTGEPPERSLQTLAKAIELRGGGINPRTGELDPHRFELEAEAATKAIIASGGLANARNLLNMMQQAGPAARGVENADTFYKGILTALMDMGGFRAGTALTALGRQLLGGKMTKPTAEEMEAMGLLAPGKWHKSGTGVFVDKGGLTGEDIIKDPNKGILTWMNDILLPAFAAHGITKGADVQQELYRVFGTETARRLAGLFIQNQSQIKRDASLYDQALAGKGYDNIAAGDWGANIKNLHDAWTNLMQAFGAPMVQPAIEAMRSFAGAMNALAGSELVHPVRVKMIGEGLIALSAGLAALGTAAVIGAAAALVPGGVIVAGIVGLGAALTALTALNWSAISDAPSRLRQYVRTFFRPEEIEIALRGFFARIESGVASGLAKLQALFVSLPAKVMTAIDAVAHALAQGIASIPGKVAGAIAGMAAEIGNAIRSIIPGGGGGGGGADKQHIMPGAYHAPAGSQRPIQVQSATYLDGKQIARTMSKHIVAMNTHPRQAAYHDPGHLYSSLDSGFATG